MKFRVGLVLITALSVLACGQAEAPTAPDETSPSPGLEATVRAIVVDLLPTPRAAPDIDAIVQNAV